MHLIGAFDRGGGWGTDHFGHPPDHAHHPSFLEDPLSAFLEVVVDRS